MVSLALRDGSYTWADLLFGATQCAVQKLIGSGSCFPPLRWDVPAAGPEITDRFGQAGPSDSG